MIDYILEQLKALTAIDSPSGFTAEVTTYVVRELNSMGYNAAKTVKGGVICPLNPSVADANAMLLTAHVDTLGAMVAAIKENGRLRITPIGGLNANNTEAENCVIYTRDGSKFSGTLQLNEPSVHVNKDYSKETRDFTTTQVVLDVKTNSADETRAYNIEVGDYVCFDPRTTVTDSGYIKSRFLDDKLSVAILLGFAKYLAEEKVVLKRKTYLHITVYEEVGHGGAASIPQGVTEVLGVDMGCVGEDLSCDEHKVSICAKDSTGPSNYEMVSALIAAAKENKLDYAVDVYPYYGSDADVALSSGHDVRHALIGAGVYASHGYERSHIDGVKNTFELIKKICQ